MLNRERISYSVTKEERRLLLSATLLGQPYERFVKRAKLVGNKYELRFAFKQLEEFVKYLDFEKDWFRSEEKRQAVKMIVSKLRGCLRLMSVMERYTNLTS